MNLAHSLRSCFYKIHFNNSPLKCLFIFQVTSFLQISTHNHCMNLSCFVIRATYTTHLIILEFVTPKIFGEKWKLWISFFTQFSSVYCYLGPNILLITLFSNTVCLPTITWETSFPQPCQTRGKIMVVYILIFVLLHNKGKANSGPSGSRYSRNFFSRRLNQSNVRHWLLALLLCNRHLSSSLIVTLFDAVQIEALKIIVKEIKSKFSQAQYTPPSFYS